MTSGWFMIASKSEAGSPFSLLKGKYPNTKQYKVTPKAHTSAP